MTSFPRCSLSLRFCGAGQGFQSFSTGPAMRRFLSWFMGIWGGVESGLLWWGWGVISCGEELGGVTAGTGTAAEPSGESRWIVTFDFVEVSRAGTREVQRVRRRGRCRGTVLQRGQAQAPTSAQGFVRELAAVRQRKKRHIDGAGAYQGTFRRAQECLCELDSATNVAMHRSRGDGHQQYQR